MNETKVKLDLYKLEREPLRKSFNDEIYKKYKKNETICKPLLKHLSSRLSELDRKIEKSILDLDHLDEELEEELKEVRSYQEKIKECLKSAKEEKKEYFFPFELPELKLFTFDGSTGNWFEFWGPFQSIVEHQDLPDYEKCSYLLQSTTGRAHDFITSHLIGMKDFKSLIEKFKSRFGNDDLLISHYMRELINISIKMETNKYQNNLKRYYLDLFKTYNALNTFGFGSKQHSIILLIMMEKTMPPIFLRDWLLDSEYRNYKKSLYDSLKKEEDDKSDEDPIYEKFFRFLEIRIKPFGSLF